MTGRWTVLGAGRAGMAFARLLATAGCLDRVWTRDSGRFATAPEAIAQVGITGARPSVAPTSDRVLICVPDDALLDVVGALGASERAPVERIWLHCSGVRPGDLLRPLVGGPAGSAHPLMALGGGEDDLRRLTGAFVALDGDGSAREAARELVDYAGALAGEVPAEHRAAYHLAAVIAGNGVFALLEAANRVAATAGIADDALRSGLARLAEESARAAAMHGVDAAITGPVSRGDAGTVHAHRAWLASHEFEGLALDVLYRELGCLLLDIAERRGLTPASRERMRAALALSDVSAGGRIGE